MKCLCPCPLPSHPPPTPSPLSSPEGAQGGELNSAHRAWQPKQKPEKKKLLYERQINSEKRRRRRKQSRGAGGRGRDKEMKAETGKEIDSSSEGQTRTHRHTRTHTCTVCSAGSSACVGSRNVVFALRHTSSTCPRSLQRLCTKKYDVMSAYSLVCVCVGCIPPPLTLFKQC